MDRRRRIKTEAAASTLKGNNILMLTPSDGEQEVDTRRESSAKCSAKAEPHDANNVLDDVGVWNVAQVRNIPSKGKVTVRYEGWGPEFDEAVSFVSGRIAPFHTYTSSVKCWVKYLNWPWWPGVATIRVPGNDDGIANLQTVDKLFVNFLDKKQFTFWVKKKDVRSFDQNFEENCKGSTDRDFEFSLNHVFQSTAGALLPRFGKGTLPKQFESRAAPPIDVKKDVVGREKWLEGFVKNREMHFQMHGGNEAPMVTKPTTTKRVKVKKSEPVEEVEEEPSPKLEVYTKGKRASAAKAKPVTLVLNEQVVKPKPVAKKGKALTTKPVKDDNDSDEDVSDNMTVIIPKPPRVMNAVDSIPSSQNATKESKHARNTVAKESMKIQRKTKEKKRSVRNENTEINAQADTQSSQPPYVPEVPPVQAPAVIMESLKPWNGLFVNPRSVEEEEKDAAANDMSSRTHFSTGGRASKMRVGSFGTLCITYLFF
uniref:PWWP domain-containing protein n=1 Tax=Globisporangium ultimum (strain ATCC 200006 / CBS 805.95 / DAOM BR144) TaxID=431595 RepID=K3WES9_GLOUD